MTTETTEPLVSLSLAIAKLELGPNDRLVVKCDERLTPPAVENIKRCFKDSGLANQVIVLGRGMELAVLMAVELTINERRAEQALPPIKEQS